MPAAGRESRARRAIVGCRRRGEGATWMLPRRRPEGPRARRSRVRQLPPVSHPRDTAAVPIRRRPRPCSLLSAAALAIAASLGAQTAIDAVPSAAAAARTAARRALCADLTACAQHHLADKAIPGIWLALLDVGTGAGGEWSWSTALGVASPGALPRGDGVAAVDAVHRVASLGKLVTATLAMVLAER